MVSQEWHGCAIGIAIRVAIGFGIEGKSGYPVREEPETYGRDGFENDSDTNSDPDSDIYLG